MLIVKFSKLVIFAVIALIASTGATAFLDDGLEAYYRFDGNQSIIEDASGSNNSLRYDSNALHFDGVDDYAEVDHYDELNLSLESGFAVSVDFRVENFTKKDIELGSMSNSGYGREGNYSPEYDSYMRLGGTEICGRCTRGITIAHMNDSWDLVELKEFDTHNGENTGHGNACNAAGNMTQYLKSLPSGSRIMMVTTDQPHPADSCGDDSLIEEWRQTLGRYGANTSTITNNTEYASEEDYRSSYLLIGEKNLGDSGAYYYGQMPRYGTGLYFDSGQMLRVGRQFGLRASNGELRASVDKNVLTANVEEKKWYNAVLQFNPDNSTELWVDGEKIGEKDISPTDNLIYGSLNDLVIGGPFFQGDISRLKVFDTNLTEDEIKSLSQQRPVNSSERVAEVKMREQEKVLVNSNGTDGEWKSSRTRAVYGFEENNFKTLVDRTGNSNNLEVTGGSDAGIKGANWTDGRKDDALDFEKDYVDIDEINLGPQAQKTVSLWFKADSWGSYRNGTGLMRDNFSENDFDGYIHILNRSDGSRRINVEDGSGVGYGSGSYPFELNRWHHVSVVFDENEVRFYADGEFIGSQGSGLQNSLNLSVIGAGYGNSQYHDGKMDEVKVYNRSLTQEEVKDLSRLGRPEKGLIREWNFDRGSGDTAYETSYRKKGVVSRGLELNGSYQYASSDSFPLANSRGSSFSFSAWIRSENGGTIIGKSSDAFDTESGDENLLLEQASGNIRWKIEFNSSNDGDFLEGSKSVNDGKWHHVVGVRDNWTYKIYVDGELDAEYEKSDYYVDDGYREYNYPLNENSGLDIGHYRTRSSFFDGKIDEIIVEDRALSPEEVEKLFREGRASFPSSSVTPDIQDDVEKEGIFGTGAYSFGEDGKGATADNLFRPHNGFTVSTWVRNNEEWGKNRKEIWTSGSSEVVIRADDRYGWGAGGAMLHWYDGNSWYGIRTDTNLTKGKWYHLAGVYNESSESYSFYLNGREQKRVPPSSGDIDESEGLSGTTLKQYIGRHQSGANNWNGNMDELRFYNRPLKQSEIKALAFS